MAAQTPLDQYVQIGSVKTRFWAVGEHGATVLLVHGLGGHVEDWAQNIRALAGRHRVYALDLVGCGRSDKPRSGYSLAGLAEFVHSFMRSQGLEQASLVAHSLGGAVSLYFTLRFPQQVEKLGLVSSAGLGRQVAALLRVSSLPVAGEWLTRPRRRGVVQYLHKATYDPAVVTEEVVETNFLMAALPGAQRALLSTLRATFDLRGTRKDVSRPILDALAGIAAPTLVVWGRQDRIVPAAHAAVAGRGIPRARVHLFDGCGHFPQWERPGEFNALLLEFLNGDGL
jgi:4,5:9,10-diseco-3-hydroxy-5,9,17-trioxoandrosta-1(10),2-diene-4-oate hydrolase